MTKLVYGLLLFGLVPSSAFATKAPDQVTCVVTELKNHTSETSLVPVPTQQNPSVVYGSVLILADDVYSLGIRGDGNLSKVMLMKHGKTLADNVDVIGDIRSAPLVLSDSNYDINCRH